MLYVLYGWVGGRVGGRYTVFFLSYLPLEVPEVVDGLNIHSYGWVGGWVGKRTTLFLLTVFLLAYLPLEVPEVVDGLDQPDHVVVVERTQEFVSLGPFHCFYVQAEHETFG